jgi:hypothetical protein
VIGFEIEAILMTDDEFANTRFSKSAYPKPKELSKKNLKYIFSRERSSTGSGVVLVVVGIFIL